MGWVYLFHGTDNPQQRARQEQMEDIKQHHPEDEGRRYARSEGDSRPVQPGARRRCCIVVNIQITIDVFRITFPE